AAPPAAQASIDGAIAAVGPGDTLNITILGPNGSETRVTVDAEGQIVAPLIGDLRVSGLTPSAIGKRIAQDLRNKGYMTDPQVTVEVVAFRSRIVSVLGQVQRPGRYPIEGRMSVLELLAMAGGATDGAGEVATLVRRADGGNERLNLYVNNGQAPSRPLQDTELEPGDVVFVPEAPRFYVYGEVGKPGAYPIEKGLNVMRALSVAGGLTPRASDSRIDIHRTDPLTGATTDKRVSLTDTVQPGDVIHVNERFF
ncbi:SLBB domain-containing protein, partial [Bordetella avium]